MNDAGCTAATATSGRLEIHYARKGRDQYLDERSGLPGSAGNGPPSESASFTPNATGAGRLIGEAYPFGPRTRLALTADNHNSVNGIREFACRWRAPDLDADTVGVLEAHKRERGGITLS